VAEFERLLSESGRSVAMSNENMMQIMHPLTPEAARDIKALCDMFGEFLAPNTLCATVLNEFYVL
jgi:hypothetical protein